jgi:type III secretion protein W
MTDDRLSSHRIQNIHRDPLQSQIAKGAEKLAQYLIAQEAADVEYTEWSETSGMFNPMALTRNAQTLDRRVRERTRSDTPKETAEAEEETALIPIEKVEEVAEEFQRKNHELQARTLLSLRSRIKQGDTAEEIIRKLQATYQDIALADEALDFLVYTLDPETRRRATEAKEILTLKYGREILAGRNMGAEARTFSEQGLGSPTALRDLYRSITGNPREPAALFQELSDAFPYEKLKIVIEFILHALGADMKAKGPSISRAELQRLFSDTRSMQAILGVFRFFKSRMSLIAGAFDRKGLVLPSRTTFELLARLLVRFLQEKYPSVEKALSLSQSLGIADEAAAQLVIYTQFRDAIRQVSPRLFKSDQQRQEMLTCFIDTLEELEKEEDEGNAEEEPPHG